MRNLLILASALLLTSCAIAPSTVGTVAAVAAKPTQESLESYFDLEAATDTSGALVSADDEALNSSLDDCGIKAIAQYEQDLLDEAADSVKEEIVGGAAVASGAGSLVGGALMGSVAVLAAPATLAYTAYTTAEEMAARFEAEKDYALQLQQCVGESGFVIELIDQ